MNTKTSHQYHRLSKILLIFLFIVTQSNKIFCQPKIISFSPTMATVGSNIHINGFNFNEVADKNVVFFGATKAIVSQVTANSIIVVVPEGATFSSISVLDIETGLIGYSGIKFMPTFSGIKVGITVTDFDKLSYGAGSGTNSVALGDLNGDGKADIVSTSSISDDLTIRLNTSIPAKINFLPITNIRAGSLPLHAAIADLNGDGKLDIAVANSNSNTVSVFRNTSTLDNLSFTRSDYATDYFPRYIAIADLNNDGRLDLIVNDGDFSLSIFKNISVSGSIAFESKINLSISSQALQVATADLDQDGLVDIITDDGFNNRVSVLRNTSIDGSISFNAKQTFSTGYAKSVTVGDFDGDGKLDIAAGNNANASVSILRNISSTGNINFSSQITFPTGKAPYDITAGDVNGDGLIDIMTSDWQGGNKVSILANSSTSGIMKFEPHVEIGMGRVPNSLAAGDFDNDGKLDIITSNNSGGTFSILRNYQHLSTEIQAKKVIVSDITNTQAALSWTNGGGTSRAVFIRSSDPEGIPIPPLDNFKTYASNAMLHYTTEVGSSRWYCVYNGNGNNVSISGLSPGVFYHVMVCEYDGGSGEELYATFPADANPVSFTTPSNDAALSNVTLSVGSISPSFSSGTYSYTSLVSNSTTSIKVTPTASNVNALIKVNGVIVASGSASNAIPISLGLNSVLIEVVSQDGSNVKNYNLAVGKGSGIVTLLNLTLSAGVLSPIFSAGVSNYTSIVPNSVTSISVTPSVANAFATVTVNGATTNSGTPSSIINLNEGINKITVSVTAENGLSRRDNVITVTRETSTLPLDLLSFEAVAKPGETLLIWKTSAEKNTERFDIEYSLDGITFHKLADEKAASESSDLKVYKYLHQNPSSGFSYYRLKMIDHSGLFSYSKLIVVDPSLNNFKFTIHPNPANETLKITHRSKGSGVRFDIIDLNGRIIRTIHTTNKPLEKISLEGIVAGTYLISLTDDIGTVRKLLIVSK